MDWNAPYLDHKIWILDHLEQLHCEPKEALVLLLIDLYNDLRQPIHHEEIAQKLGIDTDEVESLFLSKMIRLMISGKLSYPKQNLTFHNNLKFPKKII